MGKDTPQYGFTLPSQHLLPDCKNKTRLLQQLRHPLWLYTLIKPPRTLLLPKAAKTIWLVWLLHMKPWKIMVLILKLCFLPPCFFPLSIYTCDSEDEQDILCGKRGGDHVDSIFENFCSALIISFLYILKSIILVLVLSC